MIPLDEEEQRIEDEAEQMVPVSGKEKERIEAILVRARKKHNLRLLQMEYSR